MSVDGLFLHQIHKEMMSYLPCKINKIYLVSDTELLFHCRGNKVNFKLLISTHPMYARMNITERNYPTPEVPQNFTMLLRKHLEGGIITSFTQEGLDRIFLMQISSYNTIGDKTNFPLYIELMGKYANIILCDESNRIMDALKRIPPYENTVRIIQPGANYTPVDKQQKKDPRTDFLVSTEESLVKQFHGFSPLLANEVEYRMQQGETFEQCMTAILSSSSMFIHKTPRGSDEYHCIPLTHLQIPYQEYPIMEGFDVLFYHKEERDRIRQQTGDLFKFTRKELSRNRGKLVKLEQTMEEALLCDKWRISGELLYTYAPSIKKGERSVTLPSFEDGSDVLITLDPKFDVRHNAKKCYQKYTKGKNALGFVGEQITKTKQEIQYFELIEAQLDLASFQDAKEIRQELATKGYMKQLVSKVRRKKETTPAYSTYEVDGALIFVGKNNLQNDYVTWKLAWKSDLWLHTKDLHGSHVVVRCAEVTEPILRAAANLAAFYSQGKLSSSVPVNYCLVKELKKIPGSALGLVALSNYKTIYIDPDESTILRYNKIDH